MQASNVILNAFNEKVDIVKAMAWDKSQILKFFEDVKNDPDFFNVETHSRASLANVEEKIRELANFNPPRAYLSATVDVQYQGSAFPLETIYDLIGWLFSVAGDSPPGADRDNYYYPFMALYCVFMRRLVLKEQYDPQMVQITWFKQGNVDRACISANLDKPRSVKKKTDAQLRREAHMDIIKLLPTTKKGTSLVDDPNSTAPGKTAQNFGHCAESWVFMFIYSKLAEIDAATAAGFALNPVKVLPRDDDGVYQYDKSALLQALVDPCKNCAYLLEDRLKFTLVNFKFCSTIV